MPESLVDGVLKRETRAIARVLRHVDDRVGGYTDTLRALFPSTGNAFVIGVTGNPGAGKSTLTDRIIEAYRSKGATVGVLCVDPSSPFSGGAILGDRIRMGRHANDPGVFIRSLATRGHLGGLSRSARDMVRVLDAARFDVVIVETVGVGQDELEITRTAHTTLVVMAPGLGDEVQAIKAGIMETADVFAVNKADRDGADATMRDVELMIALGSESLIALGKSKGHVGGKAANAGIPAAGGGAHSASWTPPIVKCVSTIGEGVSELVEKLEAHRRWMGETEEGKERRRSRLREEMREALREALIESAVSSLQGEMDKAVDAVESKALDPYTATERLLEAFRQ